MRALALVVLMACGESSQNTALDTALIHVTTDAKMRTDTLGDGRFAQTATFVLVDAENTADRGAYVTLDGTLATAAGAEVAELKPQSLWIPAHETRMYALIDEAREPRPTAAGAQVRVRGALAPGYGPTATLTETKITDDTDKLIISAKLTNPSERPGRVIVIAAFHDKRGTPMTRPFSEVPIEPKTSTYLQFVGPKGSTAAQIFLGDESY